MKGGRTTDINLFNVSSIVYTRPDGRVKLVDTEITFYYPFKMPHEFGLFINGNPLPENSHEEWIDVDPITHKTTIIVPIQTFEGEELDAFGFNIKINSPIGETSLYFSNTNSYQISQIKNGQIINIVPINISNYMFRTSTSNVLSYHSLDMIHEPIH